MTGSASQEKAGAAAAGPRQVLSFSLGAESYGVDILRVKEIRGWTPVTKIPKVPPHLLGVLNLRGSIVPVVDLRVRFSLPKAEFTPLTVIIVLSVKSAHGQRDFGLVVDAVADVVAVVPEDLKQTPSLGSAANVEFIQGLAIVQDRMLILLDVDELIHRDLEQVVISEQAAAGTGAAAAA
jgi:purine-binding chemotaxis protein CheW